MTVQSAMRDYSQREDNLQYSEGRGGGKEGVLPERGEEEDMGWRKKEKSVGGGDGFQ